MKTWNAVISCPDSITQEQLQGELAELMAAGFDLNEEQYGITITEQPAAAAAAAAEAA